MTSKVHTILAAPVIAELMAAIERGDNGNWNAPWHGMANGLPLSGNSGKPYNGINVLLLAIAAQQNGFASRYWFTKKQVQRMGLRIRDWHPAKIMFCAPVERKNPRDGQDKKYLMARYYTVHNAETIEGIDSKYLAADNPDETPNVVADFGMLDFAKNAGASVTHSGARAYYSPREDAITMPEAERFKSQAGYDGTLAHELTHWTGHASRLARNLDGRFGTDSYAAEELVAEFGAAILSASMGRAYVVEHHASYLESWLKLLTDKPEALAAAASAAQKAADWLVAAQQEAQAAA